MAENLKDGLTEKSSVGGIGKDHKRHGPNQVPKKEQTKAKKGGKTFKIK